MISAASDQREYDAYADRTTPDECPVCGVDCRCSGPYVGEDVASAVIAATRWTVASIAARKATGDSLVTRGDWAVSFDTSSETGKVARLACYRTDPGNYVAIEYDVRHGDTFATTDDAECYALNAGRLWWYSEYKAQKGTLSDAEIESLLNAALAAEDVEMVDLCETALKAIIRPDLKRKAVAAILARKAVR